MKHKYLSWNRLTTSAVAVFLVVMAVAAVALWQHRHTDANPGKVPAVAAAHSRFSTTGAPGWWQGATRETDMALFASDHTCFTSVQYYSGTIDSAAEIQKLQTSMSSTGGGSTPSATLPMTLQTAAGQKQYDLHQYTLTSGDSSEQLMRGIELGYIQLAGSYIKVEGHCNTPEQLQSTIPALQSVRFKS
jgi:hypothetical protein